MRRQISERSVDIRWVTAYSRPMLTFPYLFLWSLIFDLWSPSEDLLQSPSLICSSAISAKTEWFFARLSFSLFLISRNLRMHNFSPVAAPGSYGRERGETEWQNLFRWNGGIWRGEMRTVIEWTWRGKKEEEGGEDRKELKDPRLRQFLCTRGREMFIRWPL